MYIHRDLSITFTVGVVGAAVVFASNLTCWVGAFGGAMLVVTTYACLGAGMGIACVAIVG